MRTIWQKLFSNQFENTSATANYSSEFQEVKTASEEHPLNFNSDEHHVWNTNFTLNKLEWALSRVSGNSAGPDDIGYPLLKQLPLTGKFALVNIINDIWNSGNIALSWKEAIVIPVPKGNKNPLSRDSYRPISLLSCPAKIVERLVNRRLITILEDRNLLNKHQFAFRQGKGTESHLAELENIFCQNLSKG